jgi:hypothetical protein
MGAEGVHGIGGQWRTKEQAGISRARGQRPDASTHYELESHGTAMPDSHGHRTSTQLSSCPA